MSISDRYHALPIAKKIASILRFDGSASLLFSTNPGRNIAVNSLPGAESDQPMIESCLVFIRDNFPDINALIHAFTDEIYIEKSNELPGYAGFSTYDDVGRMRLINVNALQGGCGVSAPAIIHEGIHQFLFDIENQHGFFLRKETMLIQEQIESPWTRNGLYLMNIPHAASVWYGLHRYWNMLLEKSELVQYFDFSMNQKNRIGQAFMSAEYQALIAGFAKRNEKTAVSILETLRMEIGEGS